MMNSSNSETIVAFMEGFNIYGGFNSKTIYGDVEINSLTQIATSKLTS